MKEFRIELAIRNNHIIERMRMCGYNNVAEFSRANGLNNCMIGNYINLKTPAVTKTGAWKQSALNLSDALKCMPGDLWTDLQREMGLAQNRREIRVDQADISAVFIDNPDPMQLLEQKEFRIRLEETVSELDERLQDILRMRFALAPYHREYTLREIGEIYSITRERVRQIEIRAIRKLRQPELSKRIRGYL
jgi:RNA polymerase sigma factor (sigma-70 family)